MVSKMLLYIALHVMDIYVSKKFIGNYIEQKVILTFITKFTIVFKLFLDSCCF
jgi:hypothetical protein